MAHACQLLIHDSLVVYDIKSILTYMYSYSLVIILIQDVDAPLCMRAMDVYSLVPMAGHSKISMFNLKRYMYGHTIFRVCHISYAVYMYI